MKDQSVPEKLSLKIEYIIAKYVPWNSDKGNYLLEKLHDFRYKNFKKKP